MRVFNGLCYTVHSSPAAGDEYYVAAILLLDFNDSTKLLEGRAVYHATKGNLEHLRGDLVTNFEEVRCVTFSPFRYHSLIQINASRNSSYAIHCAVFPC